MAFLKLAFVSAVLQSSFIGFLVYSPLLLDIEPQEYDLPVPPALKGSLAQNELLTKTEKLFQGRIAAPESFTSVDGKLYTGTASGHVVRIDDDETFTEVVRFGSQCSGPWEQHLCGRPLGIRSSKRTIYVTDAYRGLHAIDLTTGKKSELLPSDRVVDGKNLTFLDHLDVDEKKGKIYVTQFSTKWNLDEVIYSYVERENSGRVLSYDMKTGEVKVLLDKVYAANGIQLTPDGTALLIAETWTWRILRYELGGSNKGQVSVFAQLPGEVDNIVFSPRGGYWVAVIKTHEEQDLTDMLASYPTVRKVIARIVHGVGSILFEVANVLGNMELKKVAYEVKSGKIVNKVIAKRCMIVELDAKGEIVRSLQSSDPNTCFFTEVAEEKKYLYLGSYINSYLGRLKL